MINLKFFSLRGQQGFSLVEAITGGAILAGVALAGVTLFRNQSRDQSKIEYDQLLSQYHNSLAQVLEVPANCNATLRSFADQSSIGPSTINSVSLCSNNCTEDFIASDVTVGSNFISTNDYIDQNSSGGLSKSRMIWKLQSITPVNTLTKTGSLRIRFSYALDPRIGTKIVNKDVLVGVRFQNNQFKNCFNSQESSVNNLHNDICKSLFSQSSLGQFATNGQITYFDNATQKCLPNNLIKDCSGGKLIVNGFRSDGTIHCVSPTRGFDPTPLADTTACSPGTKAQLSYDSATKKLKVVCL